MRPMGNARKLILVVEDDPIDRDWLNLVLRRAGHEVLLAGHGEQALDYLQAGMIPDLILLDMMLPVLDGWRFLEWIRNDEKLRTVPILIITAASSITAEWATAHGCVGILQKPIEAESLIREASRWMQK
jgi:CheY-like chemotaxis protein